MTWFELPTLPGPILLEGGMMFSGGGVIGLVSLFVRPSLIGLAYTDDGCDVGM